MLVEDLRLAYDRAAYAQSLGVLPDAWQAQLLRSTSDRVILNCCRQSGKSTMSAVIALHRAIYDEGSLSLILAPSERQAKETFAKVLGLYRKLGHTVPSDSHRKLGLPLANGSRIEALPGSERTIRGFSAVDLLILDEAARVADDLYHALRPMLAVSRGALMLLSTPAGERGAFFEAWTSGSSAGWERYRVSADQVPRISAEFLAEERAALPSRVYRQEYECSFEALEGAIFTMDEIMAVVTDDVAPMFPSEAGLAAS
jgi:hypothetical protein